MGGSAGQVGKEARLIKVVPTDSSSKIARKIMIRNKRIKEWMENEKINYFRGKDPPI